MIIGITRMAHISKEVNAKTERIVHSSTILQQDRSDVPLQNGNLSEKSEGTIAVVEMANRQVETVPTDVGSRFRDNWPSLKVVQTGCKPLYDRRSTEWDEDQEEFADSKTLQ